MTTYLSIDMDYFNGDADLYGPAEMYVRLERLLRRASGKSIPLIAVMNHQQLLPFVNASGATQLDNIDEHADIESTTCDQLSCGSWVSYVAWRRTGTYRWITPQGGGSDCVRIMYDQRNRAWSDWGRLTYTSRAPSVSSLLADCAGVGICLSPAYVDPVLEPVFRRLVRDFGIRYLKGQRSEYNSRWTRPSGCGPGRDSLSWVQG